MIKIEELLSRFKNLTNNEKIKKEIIIDILVQNGIPLNSNQITIIKKTLFLKVPPITKTEILLKKEDILKQIKKVPGLTTITLIQ